MHNKNDTDFQKILLQLKKLCKRERMLVTICNKRINELEKDKDNAEQNLMEFMNKNSIAVLNGSGIEDSEIIKEFCSSTNDAKTQKILEGSNFDSMDKGFKTLKNISYKLLADKEVALDKLRNQFDHSSSLPKSQCTEGLKSVMTLEKQIDSLLKTIEG